MSGSAQVTNSGRGGMMSASELEFSSPLVSQAKFGDETSGMGK